MPIKFDLRAIQRAGYICPFFKPKPKATQVKLVLCRTGYSEDRVVIPVCCKQRQNRNSSLARLHRSPPAVPYLGTGSKRDRYSIYRRELAETWGYAPTYISRLR